MVFEHVLLSEKLFAAGGAQLYLSVVVRAVFEDFGNLFDDARVGFCDNDAPFAVRQRVGKREGE